MPLKGFKHSEATRAKMSASKLGERNHRRGVQHTPETRQKMSQARAGKALGNRHASRYEDLPGMPEAIARDKAYKKAYYAKNKERILARAKAYRGTPGYRDRMDPIKRRSRLRSRYGIDHDDYLALLFKQDGKCAICGSTETTCTKSKYFDVDHNHTTGQVRGLLCRDCNVTAGVVEKKWDKIQLIRQYLAEWDGK